MKNFARYSALKMNASSLVIPRPPSVIIPKTNLGQIFEYPKFLEKFLVKIKFVDHRGIIQ